MPLESIVPNGLAPYPKDIDGEEDKELLAMSALSGLGNAKVNCVYVLTSPYRIHEFYTKIFPLTIKIVIIMVYSRVTSHLTPLALRYSMIITSMLKKGNILLLEKKVGFGSMQIQRRKIP